MRRDRRDENWRDPDPEAGFEISSLDVSEEAAPSSLPMRVAGEAEAWPETDPDDIDLALDPRMTPRRQALAAATSVAVVVLAVVFLLSVPVGGSPLLQGLFPTPIPTAVIAPGDDQVTFENAVPWGVLRLDGRPTDMPTADLLGGHPFPLLQLSRGSHTIDYAAAPFPPRHCLVSVPAAAADTCAGNADVVIHGVPLRSVDLQATPDNLPPDQYAALAAVVQAALVFPPAQLAPGDHYERSDGRVAAATGAWNATLLATLNQVGTGTSAFNLGGQPCGALCLADGSGRPSPTADANWLLFANVHVEWQVTDETGREVDTAPIMTIQEAQVGPPVLFAIAVQWSGYWSAKLTNSTTDALGSMCGVGAERLATILIPPGVNTQGGISIDTPFRPSLADGCLLRVEEQPASPTGPGTPFVPAQEGNFLYRFGALVAAGDSAHALAPQLPLPSTHERTLAANLAST